jgi:hypothetical protein
LGDAAPGLGVLESAGNRQRQFFEFPRPLFSVAISPASAIVRVGTRTELRALPRDRSHRRVDDDLEFHCKILKLELTPSC